MDTKDRILDVALRLFAERGFYGASMDQIARELGLTKQALIHHFGTKEKLYGAVLAGISKHLIEEIPDPQVGDSEGDFVATIERIYERTLAQPDVTCVLVRELLDNRDRAAKAGSWYLRPFLDGLVALLRQEPAWRKADDTQLHTHIYQILGAINYFGISAVTLENMYSSDYVNDMQQRFPEHLRKLSQMTPVEGT